MIGLVEIATPPVPSPAGATALYESLGFRPERTFSAYRKPL